MGGKNMHHDEREARLPQWAQRHIEMLRSELASANRRAEQVENPETSRIRWGDDDAYRERRAAGIPDDQPVTFTLQPGVELECKLEGKEVRVWASDGRDVVICPASAGTLTIGAR